MKVWEKKNRELRSVCSWFAGKDSVNKINWRRGIARGETISPGTVLAVIIFNDGTVAELTAPSGCTGRIAATNRRVDKEALGEPPSQWLVRLE